MKLDELKNGLSSAWGAVADGWRHLKESATGALTHFKPEDVSQLPLATDVDDKFYFPSAGWGMLAGNVFEDDKKVVVRIEIPGMDKDRLNLEVSNGVLTVSGEKRFERERSEGRYRTFQCAYGSFQRNIPLPTAVITDKAKATYRDGVLRVEMPKQTLEKPRCIDVEIK